MNLKENRQLIFISFSQFGTAFSFNFINVFLPFFIFKISPYSYQDTLLWIGAIMGATSLFSALTSPLWGSLTSRFSPKLLYLRGIIVHSAMFFLMGFTTNLHIILALRILQGVVGGISTIGLIVVTSSSPKDRMPFNIGVFQSSMTLGQLVGPPLGTLGVVIFGYKGAFIIASAVLFASFIFCQLYVTDIPKLPREAKSLGWATLDKRILIGWMLCFTAQIQLIFLPSVLPNVFEKFEIEQTAALKLAGVVVMLYTATAMIGTYICSWLSRKFGLHRIITFIVAAGIIFQSLLTLSKGIVDFTAIRMVQTGLVAATIPLVISIFVSEPRGGIIGFLNSARFTGNALGPMLATSVLAFSNLTSLYFFISGLTLITFLGFKVLFKQPDAQAVSPS